MKHLIYILAFCLLSNLILAQTTTENYLKTTAYKKPVKTQGEIDALQDDDKIESITYFDGLGRPVQSIAKQAGGHYEDLVTPILYDEFGRQLREYLPYSRPASSLNFDLSLLPDVNGAILPLNTQYQSKYGDDLMGVVNPYSEKALEASPLNRVLEQAAPGSDWSLGSGHTIRMEYLTNTHDPNDPGNTNNDNVVHYDVSHPNNDTKQANLVHVGHYAANVLYKTVTKDENWTSGKAHTTEEFTNKQGQVVLKRTFESNVAHDTYYVYDDYGNLTFVLPPLAEGSTGAPSATDLDKLCYQYRYDHRNRLIEKRIPGKGWEYIVYDKLDRPILTQDANMGLTDKWLFTKYDVFGRVVYTGMMSSTASRPSLQNSADGHTVLFETRTTAPLFNTVSGTDIYYSNDAFPNSGIDELHSINYYDDYLWDSQYSVTSSYDLNLSSGMAQTNNSIEKTSALDSWDQGFVTDFEIPEDGYIHWKATQTDKRAIIGLSYATNIGDPNTYSNNIDYSILIGSGTVSRAFVYEGGAYVVAPAVYYVVGDEFEVGRVGTTVYYKKNGQVFHTSLLPSVGTLKGEGAFRDTGAIVEDVFVGFSSYGQSLTQDTKGLATGSKVRTLGTALWTHTETHYDQKARPIFVPTVNHYTDVDDVVYNKMDFTGKLIASKTSHTPKGSVNAQPVTIVDKFIYDQADRLSRHSQIVNDNKEELIVKNVYDDLGQLQRKQVGGELVGMHNYTNVSSGISITGKNISKTSGSGWTTGLSSSDVILGDGYVSFSPGTAGRTFVMGLSYSDADVDYNTIDYAIYISFDGRVAVFEHGADRGDLETWAIHDVFSVERRENTVYYLKNGEPFYTSNVLSNGQPMVLDASVFHKFAIINEAVLVDLDQGLQDVDYSYNIRGWLKDINDVKTIGDDLFAFRINYKAPEMGSTNPALYNGNITETIWKTANDPNDQQRGYAYQYDELNRLVSGEYGTKTTGVFDMNVGYDATKFSYDLNGNITYLERFGDNVTHKQIDQLSYTYDGNQLLSVADAGTGAKAEGFDDGNTVGNDYLYDSNGNMTQDLNKGITAISYNHLNLPTTITIDEASISYVYDASGQKLEKNANGDITTYAGNFIYQQLSGQSSAELKFFSHPEGYTEIDRNTGAITYVYQYKDHLGNIRLSYADSDDNGSINSSTEIIEENNYYPFGLEHKGYNGNVSANVNSVASRFKFGGKEFSDELGLDTYDFGARNYEASLGRWMSLDPLADKYAEFSPYNYVLNNPLSFIDPDGEDPINPRTGKPYKINMWKAIPISGSIDETKSNRDNVLYDKADRTFLGLDGFDMPRERNSPDGIFGGASSHKQKLVGNNISEESHKIAAESLGLNRPYISHIMAPRDGMWGSAAESGTYAFISSSSTETEWANLPVHDVGLYKVEDNFITQKVLLSKHADDIEYTVSEITNYDIQKGDIKTREVKSGLFGWGRKTQKYRTLTVTERFQKYNKNGEKVGDVRTKTYTKEQIIEN